MSKMACCRPSIHEGQNVHMHVMAHLWAALLACRHGHVWTRVSPAAHQHELARTQHSSTAPAMQTTTAGGVRSPW